MSNFNVGTFLFDIFTKVVELSNNIYNFIMSEYTVDIFGTSFTISFWGILGGVAISALIIGSIIRR